MGWNLALAAGYAQMQNYDLDARYRTRAATIRYIACTVLGMNPESIFTEKWTAPQTN